MGGELVNTQTGEVVDAAMTLKEIQAKVALVEQVMGQVMQPNMHYGKIPGCGDKPTLLKPGAEKLSMVFRLRPIIKETGGDIAITYLEGGHKDITVYCHVYNMQGVELATGVGSASTMESKYRYRGGEKKPTGKPVPKEYWNEKDPKKKQELIGGKGFTAAKIDGAWQICEYGEKMENPDIADVYNTVLKIAKKRAYIDGILSATGASDTFTQDLEDLPDHLRKDKGAAGAEKPEQKEPAKAEPPKAEPEFKEMKAAFASKCPHCDGEIKKGDPIVYVAKTKQALHPDCFKVWNSKKDASEIGM